MNTQAQNYFNYCTSRTSVVEQFKTKSIHGENIDLFSNMSHTRDSRLYRNKSEIRNFVFHFITYVNLSRSFIQKFQMRMKIYT